MLQLNEIKGDINFGNTNFKNLDFLINLKKIRGFVQLKVEWTIYNFKIFMWIQVTLKSPQNGSKP